MIDDLAARRFAAGLGLDALDKLALVMWLSVSVYEDVRKVVEGLG